jgi:probable rRNA maturation factor
MASELRIQSRYRRLPVNSRRLRRIIADALKDEVFHEGITAKGSAASAPPACRVTFFLVGAGEMATVNETHLGHDGSTDVITFDYGKFPSAAGESFHLDGEVFISVDDALSQAREFGTTWQEEVVRYAVHALLHLAGFDDLSTTARRIMKRHENRIVAALGRRHDLTQLGQQR